MTYPHGDSPSIGDVNMGGQDHEKVPTPKKVGNRAPLAMVDIETTGLYKGALIHEVAVWSTRDGPWQTKIKWSKEIISQHRDRHAPWCPLSGNAEDVESGGMCNACNFRHAQRITGYPDDGWDDGMTPADARSSLYDALDGHALIAHNGLAFDMPRIRAFLWPWTPPPIAVDSMHMYRLLLREVSDCKGFSLDKLSDFLGIDREGQHLAMSGVLQLAKITKRIQELIALGLKHESLDTSIE